MHMPTSSDDIQQKNRQPIFGNVETRLKMTFHSPAENLRATRRLRKPLSKTPLLFFPYENVFRKKGKTISIQTNPNLIISRYQASHPHTVAGVPFGSAASATTYSLIKLAAITRGIPPLRNLNPNPPLTRISHPSLTPA
jgi:hypothetical protein